ncbi:MAG: preprotein translocase subunit YajC [Clostridiales bacterium]|nr:preprotein translocase subunit YajC [Clostridiales bacterium]
MIQFLLETAGGGNAFKDNWVFWVLVAALLIVFIILPIFTQRRNNKKYKEMIEKIHIGDEVKTIGGIVGRVVEILDKSETEKYMVLETGIGGSKSTMVFDMNAILNVVNPAIQPQVESLDQEQSQDQEKDQENI